jgi:uncharacterized membrane protein
MNIKSRFPAATFPWVAAIALVIFLRFTHLDTRLPDHDEVFTALRVSGSTEAALVEELLTAKNPVKVSDLQKYQRLNASKTWSDSIAGLAKEEPQLTPLYYATVRIWASVAGSSIASLRSWSAVLSLLAFPCLYWLCLELFNSYLTARIATLLLAVSPYYLVFSQDARHYSLWAVSILFSSAAFLRAKRSGGQRAWALYALSFAISLYACLLSILVGVGHFLYLLVMSNYRLTRTLTQHLLALSLGLVAFLPWGILLYANVSQVSKTSGQVFFSGLGGLALARGWIRQPGKLLYELNLPVEMSTSEKLLQYLVTGFGLVFTVYVLYFLGRTTTKPVWLFVLTLIMATGGGLVLQDLTLAGHAGSGGMSNLARYLIPCFLGLLLAIAHLFSVQISQRDPWQRRAGQFVLAVFMTTQLVSSVAVWRSPFVTPKMQTNFAAAQLINQFQTPLLITETGAWDVMHYTQKLNPDVQIMAQPACYTCNLNVSPEGFVPPPSLQLDQYQQVFLFPNPSAPLLAWAKEQAGFQISEVQLLPDPTADKLIRLDRR